MTLQLTSTMKAFLSDSLSICLIATSFALHLALQTTPKAPLPTTLINKQKTQNSEAGPVQYETGSF